MNVKDRLDRILSSTTNGEPNGVSRRPEGKPGMVPDIKNLYQGKADGRGRSAWVDKYPEDLVEAAENSETARYALLIRNRKCYDGRKKLSIESIVVQSPLLRCALGEILKDYPGVTTGLQRLEFQAPFKPFVHRWSKLLDHLEAEIKSEAKSHLTILAKVLGTELQDDLKARDDEIAHGVITFEHVWMLFEPGCTIFSNGAETCALRLLEGTYVSNACGKFYNLKCQNVNWDGEAFGYGSQVLPIGAFAGTRAITSLPAFPFKYHKDVATVRTELIKRGRDFERLAGYHHKAYCGIAVGFGIFDCPTKYNIDGRIIIDTYAWNRFMPNNEIKLTRFGLSINGEKPDNHSMIEDESDHDDLEDDDESKAMELKTRDTSGKPKGIKPLTAEQLMLCTSLLKGYSLKIKKWLTFSISSVLDVSWNETAFDNLVLPTNHKELILALASSQRTHKETFDDIIQGKGKGMIMLLSGPPGVGKTLTAESVAETMRAPLYMMSASDLGLDSSAVETSLSNVLEMATKWNAILLLDEADVFLEQRSAHDLERNKLVSIFLRILEYYEGILFLTTNRVDDIDAAFQSRIHVSMGYKDLTPSSRRHIWANFLATSKQPHALTEEDLDRLMEYAMNGREIKNVLKTAQLLASRKEVPLAYEHVDTVLSIEKRSIGRYNEGNKVRTG